MDERYAEETQTLRELLAIMHEHDLEYDQGQARRCDLRALAPLPRMRRRRRRIPRSARAGRDAAPCRPMPTPRKSSRRLPASSIVPRRPIPPPYVDVGDRVEAGDVLCVLEAMKLFNEIQSDYAGTIVRIVPGNGELVSQGEELFWIETVNYQGRRDFDELLADRRGLLDAPHYREQVEADRRCRRYGAASRKESAVVRQRRQRGRGAAYGRRAFGAVSPRAAGLAQRSALGQLVDADLRRQRLRVRLRLLPSSRSVRPTGRRRDRHDDERNVRATSCSRSKRRNNAGPSPSRLPATAAAASPKSPTIPLIGPDGYAAIVQEVHQVMAHIVCDLVEQRLIFDGGIR